MIGNRGTYYIYLYKINDVEGLKTLAVGLFYIPIVYVCESGTRETRGAPDIPDL